MLGQYKNNIILVRISKRIGTIESRWAVHDIPASLLLYSYTYAS